MEQAIQAADPAIWQRHLMRRGDGAEVSAVAPSSPPAVEEPGGEGPEPQQESEPEEEEDLHGYAGAFAELGAKEQEERDGGRHYWVF